MKQLIKIVTIVLVVGLLCFDVLQGSSAAIDTPSLIVHGAKMLRVKTQGS